GLLSALREEVSTWKSKFQEQLEKNVSAEEDIARAAGDAQLLRERLTASEQDSERVADLEAQLNAAQNVVADLRSEGAKRDDELQAQHEVLNQLQGRLEEVLEEVGTVEGRLRKAQQECEQAVADKAEEQLRTRQLEEDLTAITTLLSTQEEAATQAKADAAQSLALVESERDGLISDLSAEFAARAAAEARVGQASTEAQELLSRVKELEDMVAAAESQMVDVIKERDEERSRSHALKAQLEGDLARLTQEAEQREEAHIQIQQEMQISQPRAEHTLCGSQVGHGPNDLHSAYTSPGHVFKDNHSLALEGVPNETSEKGTSRSTSKEEALSKGVCHYNDQNLLIPQDKVKQQSAELGGVNAADEGGESKSTASVCLSVEDMSTLELFLVSRCFHLEEELGLSSRVSSLGDVGDSGDDGSKDRKLEGVGVEEAVLANTKGEEGEVVLWRERAQAAEVKAKELEERTESLEGETRAAQIWGKGLEDKVDSLEVLVTAAEGKAKGLEEECEGLKGEVEVLGKRLKIAD
ncbi:unnamed protein product, partial [Choristocarpus tenellus]